MAKPFQITLIPNAKPVKLKPGWHKRALAAERRHTVTTAPQRGNPAADAKAVQYAEWLAARDGTAIPAGTVARVDWQPCAHGVRPCAVEWRPEPQGYRPAARGMAQPVAAPLLRVELPHWDYEAPPVVETTLREWSAPVVTELPGADGAALAAILDPCEPAAVAELCEPVPVAAEPVPVDHIEPMALCPAVGLPCKLSCGFRAGCTPRRAPPGTMTVTPPPVKIGSIIMPKRNPIIRDDGTAAIPLTMGLIAIVDQADLHLVSDRDWHAHAREDGNGFYARSGAIRMHRLILGCAPGQFGDHRDGDGLNNRRSNLRVATRVQNSHNRLAPGRALPLGVREIRGRFYARIREGGRQVALGGFATSDEAHAAYVAEALRRRGEWVHPSLTTNEAHHVPQD